MASTVFPVAPATSPINWTLVATYTLASNANSFTFSGLSGYKAYRIVTPSMKYNGGDPGTTSIRINDDSSDGVYTSFCRQDTSNEYNINTRYIMGNPGGTAYAFAINATISQANTSGNKQIDASWGTSNSPIRTLTGSYHTTSPVTSITIMNDNSGNFTAYTSGVNLVHLYGAN